MVDTPKLGLSIMAASQSQKHVTYNESIYRLEIATQTSAINATTTSPPGSPSEGDTYIIATPAMGDWTGREGDIAAYLGGQWRYVTPHAGFICYDQSSSGHLTWDGSAWVAL